RLAGYQGGATAAAPAPSSVPLEEAFFTAAEKAPAPAPAPTAPAAKKGEAYGLFEAAATNEAAAPGSDKFGFFQPLPGATAAAADAARARGESSSIRVSVEKIDRIVNLVGELVIAQAMMQQSVGRIATEQDENLGHSLATLDRNTRDLQQAVMSIRMMPMEF